MGKVSKEDSKLWIYIPPVHTVTFSFDAPKVKEYEYIKYLFVSDELYKKLTLVLTKDELEELDNAIDNLANPEDDY